MVKHLVSCGAHRICKCAERAELGAEPRLRIGIVRRFDRDLSCNGRKCARSYRNDAFTCKVKRNGSNSPPSLRIRDATLIRQDIFAGAFAAFHQHAGELDQVVYSPGKRNLKLAERLPVRNKLI